MITPDDRIELAALGQLGEISAEFIECRSGAFFRAHLGRGTTKVVDDQLAGAEQVHAETAKDLAADAFLLTDQSEEQVFAADIIMAEEPGFFNGVFKDFFCAGSEGDVAEGEGVAARGQVSFDLHADLVDIDAHLAEHGDRDAVFFAERSEKNVLRAQVIVLEPLGLFPGVDDYFSSSFCEFFEHHSMVTAFTAAMNFAYLFKIYSNQHVKVKSPFALWRTSV